ERPGDRPARAAAAGPGRPLGKDRRPRARALRRRAAARGDRPGAGERALRAPRRRADRQPGRPGDAWDHGPLLGHQRLGHGGGHGDARPVPGGALPARAVARAGQRLAGLRFGGGDLTVYALREAVAAFRRAPVLTGLSSAMVGLALSVVGLFGLATYNLQLALTIIEERVEVAVYLRDDARQNEIDLATRELAALPEVRQVRYVS